MRFLVIFTITATILLSACTSQPQSAAPNSEVPQTNAAQQEAAATQVTAPPFATVPATLDQSTQTEIKQMDQLLNEIESSEYQSDDLSELE